MKALGSFLADQRRILFLAVFAAVIVGVSVMPILARLLSEELFSAFMALVLAVNSFRWLDFIRPVLVYELSGLSEERPRVRGALLTSLFAGLFFSALIAFLLGFFYSLYFDFWTLFFLASAGMAYFSASVPWSVMDATGRQGVAQLLYSVMMLAVYGGSVILALYVDDILGFSIVIFLFYIVLSFMMWAMVYKDVDLKSNGKAANWSALANTFAVNLFKIISDFLDRLIVGRFLPASSVGAYLVSYELLSKSNLISGYINVYYYPFLCAMEKRGGDKYLLSRFMLLCFLGALVLQCLAFLLLSWGESVIGWYAGSKYFGHGGFLPVLMTAFSLYSLAFYYQSYFRSRGEFWVCSLSFGVACLSGLSFVLINISDINVNVILVSVLIFKSSGFLMWLCSIVLGPTNMLLKNSYWLLYYFLVGVVLSEGVGKYSICFLAYLLMSSAFVMGVVFTKKRIYRHF